MFVMADFRIETDSLGEVQVPAGALWGAQTQRAVHNFPISGMRPYPAFIWAQAAVKRAAAEVNLGLGLFKDQRAGGSTISGDAIAGAIMQAADEVLAGQWNDQFVVDPFQAGAGTSHNMNTNEVIANRATNCSASRSPTLKNRSTPTITSTWRSPPTTRSRPRSGSACCGGWTS